MSQPEWFSIVHVDDEKLHSTKMDDLLAEVRALRKEVAECQTNIQKLEAENLKMINRILEAEIAVERYKNILLRKNISFPFSPMLSQPLLSQRMIHTLPM